MDEENEQLDQTEEKLYTEATLRKAMLKMELGSARQSQIIKNEPRFGAWDEAEIDDDQEGWLIIYSDLLTLLLALFVMLVAYANFQQDNFARQAEMQPSVAGGDSMIDLPHETVPGGSVVPLAGANQESKQPNLAERLGNAIATSDLADKIAVSVDGRNLNLTIKEQILFPKGRAGLGPEAYSLLDSLTQILVGSYFPISVEGHTDDLPISSNKYPSNWELSAARAAEVVRYLISKGVSANRLSAVGYGSTRPVATNTTAAGRAANRRVTLVFHLEDY